MTQRSPFRYFKTSPEIIRLAVMMYIQFPLSLRNVEDLLHERGIDISHETVRFWWNRFGPMLASEIKQNRIQQLRAYSKWKWHVDEVFVKIKGERHYLWRAVDAEGEVLESVVTKRRNKDAALKLLKKLMKRYGRAENIVTDRLRSYGAALRELGCPTKQETGRWLNNRAEKVTLAIPTKGACYAAVQANAKFAEIRLRPRFGFQSFQSGSQSHTSRPFQAKPYRCSY